MIRIHIFRCGATVVDEALPMPGHSEGMTAVKVVQDNKYVILAGDSGYCRESWQKQGLPGVMWNKEKASQSLKKLSAHNRDENCIAILATHDSEVRQSVIEL